MQADSGLNTNWPEIFRYIINGAIATIVHFGVLTFNIEVLGVSSAGVANFVAAAFGITASFLGSRYFVFKLHESSFFDQAGLFFVLYLFIAILHGLILYGWSDVLAYDYRFGFLIATLFQILLSYIGNKYLVFK